MGLDKTDKIRRAIADSALPSPIQNIADGNVPSAVLDWAEWKPVSAYFELLELQGFEWLHECVPLWEDRFNHYLYVYFEKPKCYERLDYRTGERWEFGSCYSEFVAKILLPIAETGADEIILQKFFSLLDFKWSTEFLNLLEEYDSAKEAAFLRKISARD